MKILSLDPGLHTGWAIFVNNLLVSMDTLISTKPLFAEFAEWLNTLDLDFDIVVIERYVIRPSNAGGFAHTFNTGDTLQIIGMIKSWALTNNIKIVEQNSDIKKSAHAMIFGTPYKKRANQHALDAVLHNIYYHIKKLKVSPNEFRGSSKTSTEK